MSGAASESAAAPVSHNAAGPVEPNDVCRTKLKLPYQTDSDAALLPNLIHQLGSAHEWSGVWVRPKRPRSNKRPPKANDVPTGLVKEKSGKNW